MSSNKSKSYTTTYDLFEASRLSWTTLEDNERSKGQRIAYPRYNHPTLGEDKFLILQSPWMKMFTYGVPTLGEYYKEDKDRAFLKVPIDVNDAEVKKMIDEFSKVDEHLSSEDFKKENFGKYAKKYTYQPIVRYPTNDEEEDEPSKPPYMKIKLDLTWPEGNVKTEVWKSEVLESGNRARSKVEIETVTEFATHVNYMCKFRSIFRPVKLWAHQSKMKDPSYGIVFRLVKVEVEPSSSSNASVQNYLEGDVFVDNDDEVPSTTVQSVKKVEAVKVETKKVVENNSSDDESESESESDSDSDSDSEDEKPKAKATSKGKGKSKSKAN
jgi:hypothetical protein